MWMLPLSSRKTEHINQFLEHMNSMDPHIQYTMEETRSDGFMPFLDPLHKPEQDRTLSKAIYRKPTYTEWCLQWDSDHTLSAKYTLFNTIIHRARTVCTNQKLLQKEE